MPEERERFIELIRYFSFEVLIYIYDDSLEEEKKRRIKCEELIQEAIRLKNAGEYNSAKKKLDKARKMRVAEKEETINTIEKEVLKLKSENSFWGNISKKVNEVVGKVLDEE